MQPVPLRSPTEFITLVAAFPFRFRQHRQRRKAMKIILVAMIAAAGMSVQARDAAENARPRVIVYVNNDAVQPRVLLVAESIAAGMFSSAGVRMEWRGHEPDGGHLAAGAVAIRLAPQTPVHFM